MEHFYEIGTWKTSYPVRPSMPRFWIVENVIFIDAWFKAHQKNREAK